tara:strand:- start:137 stop:508 length:372 start_codon:yes stop_codon:yes gene_type:complete
MSEYDNPIVNYLSIDAEALTQVKNLLKDKKKYEGIRISVKTRGCSGLSYAIEFANKEKNISKFDDLVIQEGVKIFIDPKASMFLIGSKMIYSTNDLKSGFDFINPNEDGRCGCGESFNPKIKS